MIRSTVRTTVLLLMLFSVVPAWADYEAGQQAWDAGRTDAALLQWKTAAATGDRRAMHALGRLYLQGRGVLQDYVEAHKWLNLAASRGEAAALAERNALAEKMTPTQVAEAQALARAWRPSGSQAVSTPEETTAAPEPVPSVNADSAPTVALEPNCVGAGEGSECWKEFSDEPGCHVWDSHHYSDQTVTWSGLCAGGVIVGEGTLVWTRDGESTESTGTVSEGRRQGHWVVRSADGGGQEGTFVDGKRQGHWVMRSADGGGQEGTFVDGKRQGHWVMRDADGGSEEGPYVEGKRHGHWVNRTSAGNAEEGPYVEGKRQGNWVESRPDGSVWMGPYVDDKMQGRWHQTGEEGCLFNEFDQDAIVDSGVLDAAECPSLETATDHGAVVSESHDGGPLSEAAEEPELDAGTAGTLLAATPPQESPEEAERSLGLERTEWEQIQIALWASGFHPGAVTGQVDSGTREAIAKWQSSQGAEATGYLDENAAKVLQAAAPDLSGPIWLTAHNQPCKLWNPKPKAGEVLTWSGDCVGGKASGSGQRVWQGSYGENVYEGGYRDGKKHGRGVQTWADGTRYEGDYVDGKKHGRGVYTWADGTRYEGDYVDGKKHGRGVHTWPSGSRYEGDYVDGKEHGRGVSTWPDGTRRTGEWRNGSFVK